MARPKGLAKSGGRKSGSLNKVTAEVKLAAQKYGPEAIETLARLMRTAESDQVKIAACREILDRAYGKPAQTVIGADDKPLYPDVIKMVIVSPNGDEQPVYA